MNPIDIVPVERELLFWIRPDGRLLDANEAACRSLGYSRDAIRQMSIWDIDPDFSQEGWPEHWWELRRAGHLRFLTRHRHRDGSITSVEIYSQHLDLVTVECCCALVRPMTDQLRTERALRESEARLALALEVSGQALFEMDLTSGDVVFDAAHVRLLKRDPDERSASFETWRGWLHPDDRDHVLKLHQEVVSGERSEYETDFCLISGAGDWVWLRSVGRVIEWDGRRRPLRMLGTHLDITARKESEKSLRLTQAAVDRAVIAITWFDADGRICYVNDEACRSVGFSREELLGCQVDTFDPNFPIEQTAQFLQRLRAAGSLNFESRHRHKDGSMFPVEVFSNYISADGKNYNVAFTRDISSRKDAEAKLRDHLSSEKALADISALMIKPGWDDLDARLDWTLECVGSLAGAARGFLVEMDADDQTASRVHEWCAEGVAPRMRGLQDLPIGDGRAFLGRLERGEVAIADLVLPDQETASKAIPDEPDAQALMCIPLRWGERLRGFLGLEGAGPSRVWSNEEIRLPRMVAEIVAHSLQRREFELALRAQTHFLENLDRVSRILTCRSPDIDVLKELVEAILDIFQADRAFFLTPCDPEATVARITMEATHEAYPGAYVLAREVPLDNDFRAIMRTALAQDAPVIRDFPASSIAACTAGICSQMAMALRPRADRPWLLGIHQCEGPRVWTSAEQRLLRSIAERVEEALNSQLLLAQLKESEARYRTVFDNAFDAIMVHSFQGQILAVNQAMLEMYRLGHRDALACDVTDISGPEQSKSEVIDHCKRALRLGSQRFEWIAKRPGDGSLFPVEVTLRAIRFGDEPAILANVTDISERKRAEEALRLSEERFAKAFRCSPAPTVIADIQRRRLIDVNDRWLSATGYAREEVVGRTLLELGHVRDASILAAAYAAFDSEGTLHDFPIPVTLKNGEPRDYLWSANTIELSGEMVRISYLQDVTERNRAEAALRQSEERFAKAFQSSPAPMVISTLAEGRIIDVNASWASMIGSTREDLLGCTTQEVGFWADAASREHIVSQLRENGPFKDMPFVISNSNGERREILWSTEIVMFGDEEVLLSSVHDLTNQKRAERALRESEARLRTAIESIPFDFFVLDADCCFVLQNLASKARLGDLVGQSSAQAAASRLISARLEAMLGWALAGELVDQEARVVSDGAERYFHNVIAPVRYGASVRGVVGLSMDITERRQAEAELRQYREHLEELVQARTEALQRAMAQLMQVEKLAALGNLVAGVAHELNTPLGNARMVASTLSDQVDELTNAWNSGAMRRSQLADFLEHTREAVDLLERNTVRAANLIGHFKEIAVDQTSVRRRRFNLLETVNEVLATLRPTLKRTAHRIELDIAPDLELDSYPGPLEQIIANLIGNSLAHGFAGIERGLIQIQGRLDGVNSIQLIYQDNGVGIPPEQQTRIFEPFFTTRLGQGGSGLGLYIVHNLVSSVLGGSVKVSSQVGAGVTFSISLPCEAPNRPALDDTPRLGTHEG
ncbi:PAS domain S-box protein [Rhabdochromatium marinum]|uniref:PAS domain S-box protein n=1 Tax=Rhabdochromatium marinum TaxID=48729 RepID=UPI001908133C|nr:PAS domain S-box protein [Rhabdochromatium marinum]MBK1650415.1 hypothetical protein [Rhabdochromatium marinum]